MSELSDKMQVGICPERWHKGERVYKGRQASRVVQCLDTETNKVYLVEQLSVTRKSTYSGILNRFQHIFALAHENLVCPIGARCLDSAESVMNGRTATPPGHYPVQKTSHVRVDVFLPLPKGRFLSALIAKNGRIDPSRAYAYILQLATAIEYLHDRGAIHGFVRPRVIFVDEQQDKQTVLRLADMNKVLFRGEIFSNPSMTVLDLAHGDEDKIKQSGLRAKRESEFKRLAGGDVWDLASLLVECVSGEKSTLYAQGKVVKLDEDTLFGIIEVGSICRRTLGQHAAEFILKCLSLSPPSIRTFVHTLREFKRNFDTLLSVADPNSNVSELTGRDSLRPVTSLRNIFDDSASDTTLPDINLPTSSQETRPTSSGSGSTKKKRIFKLALNLDNETDTHAGPGNTPDNDQSAVNVPVSASKAPVKKKRPGLSLDIEQDRHRSDEIVQVFEVDRSHSLDKNKSNLIESMLQRAGEKVSQSRQLTPAHPEGNDHVAAYPSPSSSLSRGPSVQNLGTLTAGKSSRTAAQRKFLTALNGQNRSAVTPNHDDNKNRTTSSESLQSVGKGDVGGNSISEEDAAAQLISIETMSPDGIPAGEKSLEHHNFRPAALNNNLPSVSSVGGSFEFRSPPASTKSSAVHNTINSPRIIPDTPASLPCHLSPGAGRGLEAFDSPINKEQGSTGLPLSLDKLNLVSSISPRGGEVHLQNMHRSSRVSPQSAVSTARTANLIETPSVTSRKEQMDHKINDILNWVNSFEDGTGNANYKMAASKQTSPAGLSMSGAQNSEDFYSGETGSEDEVVLALPARRGGMK